MRRAVRQDYVTLSLACFPICSIAMVPYQGVGIGARQPPRFPTAAKPTEDIARDAIGLNCH